MKPLKCLIFAIGCFVAMGLTSCLGSSDDEDSYITKEKISRAFNAVRGNYTGKVVFLARNEANPNDVADTLDVSWAITPDTMLVVNNFPMRAIAEQVTDIDLKAAILEQFTDVKLECYMAFVSVDEDVRFMLGPKPIEVPIDYKKSTHTLKAAFWNNNYSFGAKSYDSNDSIIRIVLAALYLDDNTSVNYISNSTYAEVPIYLTTLDLTGDIIQ